MNSSYKKGTHTSGMQLSLLALSIAFASQALANTETASSSGKTGKQAPSLETVTVIGEAIDPQGITGSAFVLDETELQKFEHTNINNILRSIPGVYVREEDGLGTYPRIGIRASSAGRSDKISILEDGVPASMSVYANTSAYFFPVVGRMQKIEVLKGPEILRYGPQTTAGVINLISTAIPETQGGTLNVELSDFNTRKLHAHYGATQGQWGFLLETYQTESDGFQSIDRSKLTAGNDIDEYVGKLRWRSAEDAAYRQQLDIKVQYDEEYADVSYLGLTDADFQKDSNRRYGLSELERMDRGRKSASVQHQFFFDDNTRLTSTAYWGDTYRFYNRLNQINGINLGSIANIINNGTEGTNAHNSAELLNGILQGTHDTTHANGVRYGHNHQEFEARGAQVELSKLFATGDVVHDLVVGVRRHEDLTGNAVKGISNSIYQQINGSLVHVRTDAGTPSEGEAKAWSAWVLDRISIGNWTFLPALRYEDIESKGNLANVTAANSNSLSKTTVGLGANYALTDEWTLISGVHQGFAPPGASAGQGTKGEESLNFEAGVRYRSADGQLGIDAIAFYSDYDTTIRQCLFADPCTNPVSGGAPIVDGSTQQTGAKEVLGLEFGLSATLYQSGDTSLPLRVAYTFTDGEYKGSSDLPTGVRKGDVIEYTPDHIAAIQLGWESGNRWKSYIALNYTDGTYTTNTAGRAGVDNTYLKTEDLFTVDVNVSWQLSETSEIYARVNNLLDEQSIQHRGADGARGNAPRWWGVGVRLHY